MASINFIGQPEKAQKRVLKESQKSTEQKRNEMHQLLSLYSRKFTGNSDTIHALYDILSKNEELVDDLKFSHPQLLFLDQEGIDSILQIEYKHKGAASIINTPGGFKSTFGFIGFKRIPDKDLEFMTGKGKLPADITGYGYFQLDQKIISKLSVLGNEGDQIKTYLYDVITIANHDRVHSKTQGNLDIYSFNFSQKTKKDKLTNGLPSTEKYEFMSIQIHFYIMNKLFEELSSIKYNIIKRYNEYIKIINESNVSDEIKKHLISIYLYFFTRIVNVNDFNGTDIVKEYDSYIDDTGDYTHTSLQKVNDALVHNYPLMKNGKSMTKSEGYFLTKLLQDLKLKNLIY